MKGVYNVFGIFCIILALCIGISLDFVSKYADIRFFISGSFIVFLIGITLLIQGKNETAY